MLQKPRQARERGPSATVQRAAGEEVAQQGVKLVEIHNVLACSSAVLAPDIAHLGQTVERCHIVVMAPAKVGCHTLLVVGKGASREAGCRVAEHLGMLIDLCKPTRDRQDRSPLFARKLHRAPRLPRACAALHACHSTAGLVHVARQVLPAPSLGHTAAALAQDVARGFSARPLHKCAHPILSTPLAQHAPCTMPSWGHSLRTERAYSILTSEPVRPMGSDKHVCGPN